MKVLVADKFEEVGLNGLKALGCEVLYDPKLEGESLGINLEESEAEVLIVRSTKVTSEVMEKGKGLSLIVRAGAGVNTIDLKAASARAITVSNCPGKNSIAVAELAFGLILALDRRIVEQTVDLRAGVWNKAEYSKAKGLAGRTIGIVGLGAIGKEMVYRAQAFDMRVIVWSRFLDDAKAADMKIRRAETIHILALESDVISVHLALTRETRGLCDAAFFGAMRPGAIFINTSRGEVVDEAALTQAIQARGIRAGLDVFELEPSGGTGTFEDPVVQLPGVTGTHHVGASTEQAQNAIAAEVVRIVRSFKTTGAVPNAVNICLRPPASTLLTIRHRDRVGVLAHIFSRLSSAGINVEQTENIVFEGAEAACVRIQVDRLPEDDVVEGIRAGNPDIFSVSVSPL
ncbi:MAG: hydroxyacid dehydrogenase [Acidobacteria bacterium]|nr:hydroxyacid dehydrogenase [Acidobacteriota bacterium]MCG3192681.1 Erythronate-4-phosphate dehydrogenase [Thermoanaerobaculia bacterium]